MKKILVLNGPNLNLLGTREPDIYGNTSLSSLNKSLEDAALRADLKLTCKQSNSESQLIDWIHLAKKEQINYLIFNPAAFTHTSIALRDALLATELPFIEVHLSNLAGRELFRQRSFFTDISKGLISGLGIESYRLALEYIIAQLK